MIIYEGLKAVSGSLNDAFRSSARWSTDKVVLSGLAEPDGNPPIGIENKLVLTVIGLENEAVLKNQRSQVKGFSGRIGKTHASYHFTLNVLMSAASVNYEEGLKLLSDGIGFVQSKPSITHQNTPGLHESIERLTLETMQVSVEHLSHIWGAIGSKLLPSILYKVRMITVDGTPYEFVPTISGEELNKETTL